MHHMNRTLSFAVVSCLFALRPELLFCLVVQLVSMFVQALDALKLTWNMASWTRISTNS